MCWGFDWLRAEDFTPFCPTDTSLSLPFQGVRENEWERKKKRGGTKPFFRLHPNAPSPFCSFLLLFLYCTHPALRHLSVLGWMNSSIQTHYYAERRARGRIGMRGGGGAGWRGKICGCWTPRKSLTSQPFNSLSSEVKSLTSKPMCKWECVRVCRCI